MNLDIRMDLSGALLGLAQLSDRQAQASINRSLNRAASSTGKLANSLVRKELNVKATAFRRDRLITVKRAIGSEREARVTITGKNPPLTEFRGTRQTKRGLTVKIYKSSSRKLLKSRFIYPGSRGPISAERKMVGDRRVGRGPVKFLFGPGASQFAAKPLVLGKLEANARERFAVEFERDVAFRLSKLSSGA